MLAIVIPHFTNDQVRAAAQVILDNGAVLLPDGSALVTASSGSGLYLIPPDGKSCTCPAWTRGGLFCYHRLVWAALQHPAELLEIFAELLPESGTA